ncbi:MAG: hypothetical protein KJ666_10505 [Bacteroidetes bacterium]|nr:hypothetical protein [Bacteroidota bacterium]
MPGDEFGVIGIGKTIKIGAKVIQEKTNKGIIRVSQSDKDYAIASPTDIFITDGNLAVKVVKKVKK